jgi:hypothetical protein
VFVPPTWAVLAGECPGNAPDWVEVGGPYKQACSAHAATTYIGIEGFADTHEAAPTRVVHGYQLYALDAANPNDFVIPALRVTIRAEGPERDEILATVAASAEYIALNYHALVPSGWRAVSHAGVSMSVPADWPQLPPVAGCGWIRSHVVAVGTAAGIPSCPPDIDRMRGPDHNGVEIQDAVPWSENNTGLKQSNVSNATTSMSLLRDTGEDNRALQLAVYVDATHPGHNRAVARRAHSGGDLRFDPRRLLSSNHHNDATGNGSDDGDSRRVAASFSDGLQRSVDRSADGISADFELCERDPVGRVRRMQRHGRSLPTTRQRHVPSHRRHNFDVGRLPCGDDYPARKVPHGDASGHGGGRDADVLRCRRSRTGDVRAAEVHELTDNGWDFDAVTGVVDSRHEKAC